MILHVRKVNAYYFKHIFVANKMFPTMVVFYYKIFSGFRHPNTPSQAPFAYTINKAQTVHLTVKVRAYRMEDLKNICFAVLHNV